MRSLAAATLLSLATTVAWADDFEIQCSAASAECRQAFHDAAKDVSAALNYKMLAPAEATGLLGFGIAAIGSYVPVENKDAWRTLTGENLDGIGMAGGVINKGLPFGIDVGAFYAAVPGSGGAAYGAQLRYAILEGGVASPALAVGASYTKTSGIDDFDYSSWGVDVTVSKGFAFLTPYAGVGYRSSSLKPTDEVKATYGLQNEDDDAARLFVGARITMVFFDITPEYERSGDNNVYSLRAGFTF